jgi:hypothetical protein
MKISRVLPVVGMLTLLACGPAFTQRGAYPRLRLAERLTKTSGNHCCAQRQ